MKTAISISDELFNSTNELALKLGKSRSEIFSLAMKEYLKIAKQQGETADLDKLYDHEISKIEPRIKQKMLDNINNESW